MQIFDQKLSYSTADMALQLLIAACLLTATQHTAQNGHIYSLQVQSRIAGKEGCFLHVPALVRARSLVWSFLLLQIHQRCPQNAAPANPDETPHKNTQQVR